MNQFTDVDIPRSAWSYWHETGKPRVLQRALTERERTALQARYNELGPVVAGYSGHDVERVALALMDMLAGYRSMRQTGDNATAQVVATSTALAAFPAWAIEKACNSIQRNGVWRDGKFDRQWPPNDSEIVDAVQREVQVYTSQHRSAAQLLAAEVSPDGR